MTQFNMKGKTRIILEDNIEYPYDLNEKKDPLHKMQSYYGWEERGHL